MGGTLLAVVGVWVLCQVLGGNALGRLGITGDQASPQASGPAVTGPIAPGATPPGVAVPPAVLGG
jgi:hypothetical protein